jgi:hypothetical protein
MEAKKMTDLENEIGLELQFEKINRKLDLIMKKLDIKDSEKIF